MRAAVIVVVGLAVAACGGPPASAADAAAAVDAGVDAPTSSRVCEPDRPMPAEPTSAGSMEGAWRVAWTCGKGCVLRRPGLTYSPELTVTGTTLRFSNPRCPECQASVTGVVTIDGCVDVTGWPDFDSQCRFSYRICEMDGELGGTVTWKEPGVSAQTWHLHGTR